ncbi:MAG: hypothetical protein J6Y53_04695 [Alphaproteobacteria bacterium]|nr:hypothetical protein [Alphaproteobacteria bacterium]
MLSYVLFSLVLGVIAGLSAFNKESKSAIWVGLVVALLFGVINFWALPTLKFWHFDGVWVEIASAALIGFLFEIWYSDGWEKRHLYNAIPLILCFVLCMVRIFTTAEMFHSQQYQKLLQPTDVADSTFANTVHPIPVEKMISVKQEYALDLSSKRIENMPSLGSRAEFLDADMINLNGSFNVKTAEGEEKTLTFDNEKVWVSPLEHRGFFKWKNNKVTDGYCIVSAHDPSRIFFVTEVNGKKLRLRYLPSGCFGDELERHIRSNGYAGYGLTEYSMELDDNGNPFWVVTIFEKTIGFSGEDAIGCLVVDMQTGEMKKYRTDEAPEWVDRIQPDEFLIDQINDWGQYQSGWANSVFAQNGVREATPGMSLVYSEGRSYWYSGIQSSGADKSSSGFMLIDTRTKECKLYSVAGINEQAAKDVIEAQSEWVRMSDFKANDPVLYNVHGIPTYYMTVTGDGVKNAGYAFVSLKSELLFAAASTPQKALQEYLKVVQNGNQFTITDGDEIKEELREMTIRAITLENGTYYLLFNEVKGKEFTGTTEAFAELKWAKEGQKVKVSYTETDAKVISLNTFDILNFDI